jgi:integrase
VFWIDYYVNGRRKRERIGPDKKLTETVLQKRKVAIAEGQFPEKQRPVTTTFDELAEAYFTYIVEHQRKRPWLRDRTSIRALMRYFGGKRLAEITPAAIEHYRAWRHETRSRRGRPMTTASINRELACLKRMFNVAGKGLIVLKGGLPLTNPVTAVSLERERNERDRVLTPDEFHRAYRAAPAWLQRMLLCAYHTGMREGEGRSLRWDRIALKGGAIWLKSRDTKTNVPPRDPPQPAVDNLAQNRYKVRRLSVCVHQPGETGGVASQPRGG